MGRFSCAVHGDGEELGPIEATVEEVQLFQKKVKITLVVAVP